MGFNSQGMVQDLNAKGRQCCWPQGLQQHPGNVYIAVGSGAELGQDESPPHHPPPPQQHRSRDLTRRNYKEIFICFKISIKLLPKTVAESTETS